MQHVGVLEQWGEFNVEDSMELSIQFAKGALIATRHAEIQPRIRGEKLGSHKARKLGKNRAPV